MGKRAAFYLRVSSDERTIENQRLELQQVAAAKGWEVVAEYQDEGISGAKGRDKRPGLDKALKNAVRRRYDVLMVWSVDRLGRSLADLVNGLQELHEAGVDLFLHQQAIDTTTPSGRAMFQMCGVFAEFERAMIQARIKAGIARAKKTGTKTGNPFGRPTISAATEKAVRDHLLAGNGILKTARLVGVGSGTVQRVNRELKAGQAVA